MTEQEREELIEQIKQEILRLVAKRNCIIAGIEYNENSNYVDEGEVDGPLSCQRHAKPQGAWWSPKVPCFGGYVKAMGSGGRIKKYLVCPEKRAEDI